MRTRSIVSEIDFKKFFTSLEYILTKGSVFTNDTPAIYWSIDPDHYRQVPDRSYTHTDINRIKSHRMNRDVVWHSYFDHSVMLNCIGFVLKLRTFTP